MLVNRVDLADVLGVSLPTVDKMVREGVPYVDRPGENGAREWKFDTGEVRAWEHAKLRADAVALEKQTAHSEAREKAAKAGIAEMTLAEKQKVLIHVDLVAERIEAGDAIVKSRMQAIPGRMAQALAAEQDPAVVQQLLKDEVGAALEEISKYWTDRG